MRHKRVLAAAIAVVLMLLWLTPPLSAAATFSDLENHWARENMEDLARRGYLSGYSDGTMGPEKFITAAEALTLLSRFFVLEDSEAERLYSDYAVKVESILPTSLNWAYKSAAICLAAHVVSESELAALNLSDNIEKELLSVLLVRAMLLDVPLPLDEPDFTDLSAITIAYRPYIKLLSDLGIVTGDDTKKFLPKSHVTRAVAAAMVSRAIEYMERENTMPLLTNYMGLTVVDGIIDAYSNNTLYFMGFSGPLSVYNIPQDAKITYSVPVDLHFSPVGCRALLHINKATGIIQRLEITNDATVWKQAALQRVSAAGTTRYAYLVEAGSSTVDTYPLISAAKIFSDGNISSLDSLKAGSLVTFRISGDKIMEMYASSGNYEVSGSINTITYDSKIELFVSDNLGTYKFIINAANQPKVTRGNTEIRIDRLRAGDDVRISVKDCIVSAISVDGRETNISGELIAISTTIEGTSLTLRTTAGDETFMLDKDAGFWSDSAEITSAALKIGDRLALVLYGNTVVDVYLEKNVTSSTKVTGKVLLADKTKYQIMLLVEGSYVYVTFPLYTSIYDTKSAGTIRLEAVEEGSLLTAYGRYTSVNQFEATSAIIE